MNLKTIYEDDDIIVIDKPSGLIVHHGAGVQDGTLEDLLFQNLSNDKREELKDYRFGIVHRLDKDTSGLMVVAKNINSVRYLIDQFKAHLVKKEYVALVKGMLEKAEGDIETGIKRSEKNRKKFAICPKNEGKLAISHYKVERYFGTKATKVKVDIETGRTHQIRVHMTYLNHPVIGDEVYGRKSKDLPQLGLMLHSYFLSFRSIDGKTQTFTIPEPERFLKAEEILENG